MRRKRVRLRLASLYVAPCAGMALYLTVALSAFVFSQVLRTTLSAMLLVFVLGFGMADLVLLALTVPAVRLKAEAEALTVERGGDAKVRVTVRNRGLIPVSSIILAVRYPTSDPSLVGAAYEKLAVFPFSTRTVTLDAAVTRRGLYQTGVTDVYIYDMLRTVRIRLKTGGKGAKRITVMPKCMPYLGAFAEKDGAEETSDRLLELSAIGDYGDVRDYRPGDSMKQIHWKLSTKSDELQVRKYSSETEKYASVFLDAYVPSDMMPDNGAYCEAVDRLFDEAYTAAVEAAERGCEGNVTVGADRVETRFGSKADNERLAAVLAGMGYVFSECDSLPANNGGSSIYVIPFTHKGRGAVFTDRIKAVMTSRSSVCVVSLEDLVPEALRAEYNTQLGHFLEGLTSIGIAVSVSDRGGVSRG